MPLKNDMIEIQLKSQPPTQATHLSDLQFGKPPRRYRGFPYGQYETDLDEMTSCDEQSRWRPKFTGFPVHRPPCKATSTTSLNSIRQLYCPDCKQRLDMECVQRGGFHWDGALWCCLPMLPLVQRLVAQQQRGKVICQRCGSNLGYWRYA